MPKLRPQTTSLHNVDLAEISVENKVLRYQFLKRLFSKMPIVYKEYDVLYSEYESIKKDLRANHTDEYMNA